MASWDDAVLRDWEEKWLDPDWDWYGHSEEEEEEEDLDWLEEELEEE